MIVSRKEMYKAIIQKYGMGELSQDMIRDIKAGYIIYFPDTDHFCCTYKGRHIGDAVNAYKHTDFK